MKYFSFFILEQFQVTDVFYHKPPQVAASNAIITAGTILKMAENK